MENSLATAINIAELKAEYDENIKNILSDKEVLAWVLSNTTSEFEKLSIKEIMECIEGDVEISTIKVNPGETNESRDSQRKIRGTANEDKVPNEGTITFDIRFYAYVPSREECIKIILNLEAQKKFYPGYQIVTRGIFYGSRMISAQLDTEFEIPKYDDLKKVYSIWICMEAPQYIGNAISSYSMEKKVLEEKFHINMKKSLGERVSLMCNLSDLVEERGEVKGMINVLTEMGFSIESAVEHIATKLKMDSAKIYEIVDLMKG